MRPRPGYFARFMFDVLAVPTERIVGVVIEVHRRLGMGFLTRRGTMRKAGRQEGSRLAAAWCCWINGGARIAFRRFRQIRSSILRVTCDGFRLAVLRAGPEKVCGQVLDLFVGQAVEHAGGHRRFCRRLHLLDVGAPDVVVRPGSNISSITLRVSPRMLPTRPVKTRPSLAAIETAAYWSLITLLGSTIASKRSRTPKRPATAVKSGPTPPPSWPKRWQARSPRRQKGGGRERGHGVRPDRGRPGGPARQRSIP